MVNLSWVSRRDKETGGCRIVFVIIRPMLYGKATTIHALYKALMPQNVVIFQDFGILKMRVLTTQANFPGLLLKKIVDAAECKGLVLPETIAERFKGLTAKPSNAVRMNDLFRVLRTWFQEEKKPVVLIIGEVDRAVNHQALPDFLAHLWSLYQKRVLSDRSITFRSVILAGVINVNYLHYMIGDKVLYEAVL